MNIDQEAIDELNIAHSYEFDIFKFAEISLNWEASCLAAYLLQEENAYD